MRPKSLHSQFGQNYDINSARNIEAHADRMKYNEYLAAGLPIATGVIEGAWRHLVKDRLERTVMRWSAAGAQGMLYLRAVKASNLWDDFQTQLHNTTSLIA